MTKITNSNINFFWESFLKGDDKCFTIVYQHYIDNLISYGLKLCPDKEIVEDSIQELFIDLYSKKRSVAHRIKNVKSYLYAALRNNIIRKIKKAQQLNNIDEVNATELAFHVEYSFEDRLIESEFSEATRAELKAGINGLPQRQKEIIFLKFEEGLDYKAISDILKISSESARKLLYRALLTLRDTVNESVFHVLFIFFKKMQKSMSTFLPLATLR